MTELRIPKQESRAKEFISTGQAARLCSVIPDTVLKWVKSGKIPASRTPGGHYRIHRRTLLNIIESGDLLPQPEISKRPFQFCWQFYGAGSRPKENCDRCIVYHSRAMRCYEMSQHPADLGHGRLFCIGSCEHCEYFRVVQGQKINLLVITTQENLKENLEAQANEVHYNLRLTDNEYHCSMVTESFRPDYVVIDIAIGRERSKNFAMYISDDPRIPYAKIIMAAGESEMPRECSKAIFAIIKRPFTLKDIEELIGAVRNEPF